LVYDDPKSEPGIVVKCDDGSDRLFVDKSCAGTNRDLYDIEVSDNATYAQTKKAVEAATGWTEDEQFPWLEIDQTGAVIPGTATFERISRWLDAEPNPVDLEYWGRTATQYAPGFDLMSSLTDDEQRALQMSEADLGSPASSVPCVMTGASISELNWMLSHKGLPYVFVDADGPEEG
jgi:hypothetical protein